MARKKIDKSVERGRIYISASFNNTLATVTDMEGNVLAWETSGSSGFKGTRKATPYAATVTIEKLLAKVRESLGLKELEIYIKGPGVGRDAALRAIRSSGIKISMIADVTPLPHDGPRPRKKRRV